MMVSTSYIDGNYNMNTYENTVISSNLLISYIKHPYF